MHDDVIKWKHFPRYWPFVRGIHQSPVNSLHKGQWRGALMFSLICVWINGWVNNREAGYLRRYRAHYDVIVMDLLPQRHRRPVLTLYQGIAWRLFGAKEISGTNVNLKTINAPGTNLREKSITPQTFLFRKCLWKYYLHKITCSNPDVLRSFYSRNPHRTDTQDK